MARTKQRKRKPKRTPRGMKKAMKTIPTATTKNKKPKFPHKPQPLNTNTKTIKRKRHRKNLDKHSSPAEPDPQTQIQALLQPYSKHQLLEFICDAALTDPSLLARIQQIADQDVAHRKIFVYGLGWDATTETLVSAFQSYGDIEDCKVVVERLTGKAKGYGFVVFKSRDAAVGALRLPQKKIGGRMTSCQLASVGVGSGPSQPQETLPRKIYVSRVHADVDPERLRNFFGKFGEIELGPLGFDAATGKCRGFALFVYRTVEGANRALEEPLKMFDGHQLHCQKASESKHKASSSAQQQQRQQIQQQQNQQQQIAQQQQQQQAPMLAAMAAAQNLALFSQHPSLNPAYGTMAMNSNPGLVPGGVVNSLAAGALSQSPFSSAQVQGAPFGSHITGGSVGASVGLGAYGVSQGFGGMGANGTMTPGFQGLQSFHGSQMAPSASSRALGTGGTFPGF